MRKITEIIIHCSATKEGQSFTVRDIDRWHRQRGFKMVGYHFVIRLDGTIEQGRPLEMVGAHCTGHNAHSIGICYIGGLELVRQAQRHPNSSSKGCSMQSLKEPAETVP